MRTPPKQTTHTLRESACNIQHLYNDLYNSDISYSNSDCMTDLCRLVGHKCEMFKTTDISKCLFLLLSKMCFILTR